MHFLYVLYIVEGHKGGSGQCTMSDKLKVTLFDVRKIILWHCICHVRIYTRNNKDHVLCRKITIIVTKSWCFSMIFSWYFDILMKYCLKFVRNVSTSIHFNRIRMFACCTFNVWLATVKADIWKEKNVFRGKICSFNFFLLKHF